MARRAASKSSVRRPPKKAVKKPAKKAVQAAPSRGAKRGPNPGRAKHTDNIRPGQGRPKQLTPKQRLFVMEFFAKGMNATAAYRAAGYADGPGAKANAYKLMREPLVWQAIEAQRERHAIQARMSADEAQRILEDLARDGRNEPRERIMAVRTWAVMTGNDRPVAGLLGGDLMTRRELEQLSDEELIEMANRGMIAKPALAPPLDVPLEEPDE